MNKAIVSSLVICAASAALEGILSGRGVKERFAQMRVPRYSLPLWGWFLIGALYYLVCFAVLYQLFQLPATAFRNAALAILLVMIGMNALWNYIFFRMRNLFLSFVAFLPYNVLALVLLVLLFELNSIAAWWLLPYVAYLAYASVWGYSVWKLNRLKTP